METTFYEMGGERQGARERERIKIFESLLEMDKGVTRRTENVLESLAGIPRRATINEWVDHLDARRRSYLR